MLSRITPGESLAEAAAAPASHANDLELVRRLQAGDRKAIADFVAEHADALYAHVRFRLAPRADRADDVVQEVFLAAWRSLGNYRGESSIRAWLLGIARHKIEDVYRDRLREPDALPQDDSAGDAAADPELLDARIDRQRVRERAAAILGELPEAYGTVLLWRYWEHRSVAQMASATSKTEKAIERLLDRARKAFRKRWEHGQR
jgi:RNA polymerase sigma-70 factor (ECF subfamily)